MQKALLGLLLAATAASPVAAQDKDKDSARREKAAEHYKALEQQNQERYSKPADRQVRAQQSEPQQQRAEAANGMHGDWHGRDNQQRGTAGGQAAYGQRTAWQGHGSHDRSDAQQGQYRPGKSDPNRYGGWQGHRGDHNYGDHNYNGAHNYGGNHGRRDWSRTWNRDWRGDRRYDWQRYRYSNRGLFHTGRYYAPYRGYNYRRLSIGLFLDAPFYASNYWISDPYQYRLPPAYEGTRWVRYYNDVLLIDAYSGEVVDVIYDFFV